MQKRGQGEQFNWIFILIAGTIVLTFFIVFTVKYIGLQDQKENTRVARTINENFQLLASSGVDDYVIPDNEFQLGLTRTFNYDCINGQTLLTVNNDYVQKISDQLLFMPEQTITDSFRAWIRSWNYPYYIGNIILIEPPSTIHYLIVDATHQTFVDNLKLPNTFPITIIHRGTTLPSLNTNARVAFITTTKPTTQELTSLFATTPPHLISINPEKSAVTFYDNHGIETGTQPYYGTSLLLGALVTNTADQYGCIVNKSISHFQLLTRTLETKTQLLSQLPQASCDYQTLQQTLITHEKNINHENPAILDSITTQNTNLVGNGCLPAF